MGRKNYSTHFNPGWVVYSLSRLVPVEAWSCDCKKLSGVQDCVVLSCRAIKPYGTPYARLTFFYMLLTGTHVCMAIILKLCLRQRYASPLWSHGMLLQDKKGHKINLYKQVPLPVALRHRSNLHILTTNLTDTLQTSAKITVFTDFSQVPESLTKKNE